MKWFFLFPINLILIVFCWITTPLVVLFCDRNGELPWPLHLWQTWDDSCDSRYCLENVAPAFLRYDWHSKYVDRKGIAPQCFRRRVYLDPVAGATWSIKERLQRYACRCIWLWRNPAYGFAMYLLGAWVNECEYQTVIDEPGRIARYYRADKSLWSVPWQYKDDRQILPHIRLCIFVGWKFPDGEPIAPCKAMYAGRIVLRFTK